MEKKKTTIQLIKEAANKLKDSKLKRLSTPQTKAVIEGVRKGVNLKNTRQAMLFVTLFDYSCRCRNADLDDIANYFDCSTLDIIDYVPELTDMAKRGFIHETENTEIDIMRKSYAINEDVMSTIIEGKKVLQRNIQKKSEIDKYDFCKNISNVVENSDITLKSEINFVNKKESEYQDMKFIREVCAVVPAVEDRILFYEMCNDFLRKDTKGDGVTDLDLTISEIYERISQQIECKKLLISDIHPLMKANLIMLKKSDPIVLELTDNGKKLFLDDDIKLFSISYENLDRYAFAKTIDDYLFSDDIDNDRIALQMRIKTTEIEQSNPQLHFITNISNILQKLDDRILFYLVCQQCIEGDTLDLVKYLRTIYPPREYNRTLKAFKDGNHTLLTTNMVKLIKGHGFFGDKTVLACTDKGKKLFFEEDAEFYQEEINTSGLLKPDDIEEKHLFFSGELSDQLSMVQDSLKEPTYQQLKARLQAKSLPKGIAILLYGLPGTGKTESVLQIARTTGRNIMQVNISATKSAWFGESEKIIKKVFTDYGQICKKSAITPILLFNEADAIFSKRKDVTSGGNVAQTENAIQNIILEEIEKLDGILIATTNMSDNLDAAFERRFLFKIQFDKPTIEAKQQIWMDKLPELQPESALALAQAYDFSGGEIDNVVRKAMMREVIADEQPTLSVLQEFCREEKMAKKGELSRIGFR